MGLHCALRRFVAPEGGDALKCKVMQGGSLRRVRRGDELVKLAAEVRVLSSRSDRVDERVMQVVKRARFRLEERSGRLIVADVGSNARLKAFIKVDQLENIWL